MNSKKLGMFAAAALTLAAAQANAEAKKDAKAATKAGEEKVCANNCSGNGHTCAGYDIVDANIKTPEACTGKGKWMPKAEVMKNQASLKNSTKPATNAKPADTHKH